VSLVHKKELKDVVADESRTTTTEFPSQDEPSYFSRHSRAEVMQDSLFDAAPTTTPAEAAVEAVGSSVVEVLPLEGAPEGWTGSDRRGSRRTSLTAL
jgi:hypothetical protein